MLRPSRAVVRETSETLEREDFVAHDDLSPEQQRAAEFLTCVLPHPAHIYDVVRGDNPSPLFDSTFTKAQKRFVKKELAGPFVVMSLNSGDVVEDGVAQAAKLSRQEGLPVVFIHTGHKAPFIIDMSAEGKSSE